MKNRIAIALSIVILAAAGTVYAIKGQDSHGGLNSRASAQESFFPDADEGRHPFARRIMAHVAEHLGLTDAQKTEIKSIISAERPNVEPLVRQLAATRKQLRNMSKDGNFDEAQVRSLASQQAQAIADLIVAKERVKSKVYNVLTPEQRLKAEKMRTRFESRVREGVEAYMDKEAGK